MPTASADETSDRSAPSDAVVAVGDLRYAYPGGDEPALGGVSFAIEPGEVFGFLGPSGAGKSTTQKVLTGLLDGYEGSVALFGREVADWGGDLYQRVGISAESPNHYLKLTGRENLALFASLYGGETADPVELLELVGLAEAADRRVGEYSKGMKMRLNFVRALVHDPDLLVLDEPTTGLDPSNARLIRDLIRERQADGTTVFLTTHDMTVADDLCDRVAFMVDGCLPVIDAPADLKRAHGKLRVRVEYSENGQAQTATFEMATLAEDDAFADVLAGGGLERVHSEEATLEDVFIEVTGRELA
ncbi:ABC transporter ATP-binding protein [Halobacteria archaeon HArc-gm2]|nr:ABC transporter ATP-binding protein [Halobacteria archaeon HArc-gm2]